MGMPATSPHALVENGNISVRKESGSGMNNEEGREVVAMFTDERCQFSVEISDPKSALHIVEVALIYLKRH